MPNLRLLLLSKGWVGRHDTDLNNTDLNVSDQSYELNEALWDGFFFSGFDPDLDRNTIFPLPNGRLQWWAGDSPDQGSEPEDALTDERQAAAHLLMDGAFNINSTSVAAWASVLGSMRDIPYPGQESVDEDLRHNYARFSKPIEEDPLDLEKVEFLPDHKEQLTAGYRNLSDAQVWELTKKIVVEIEDRTEHNGHPFLTLSEFINRSPDKTKFAHNGALQAAIDDAGINGQTGSMANRRACGRRNIQRSTGLIRKMNRPP